MRNAVLLAACGALLAHRAPAQFEVPDPPRISAIFSPKTTVRLQTEKYKHFLRFPEVLPTVPFALLCQVNDLAEVSFPDGTIIRQGPNTLVKYDPAAKRVAVVNGSALIRFSAESAVEMVQPEIQGKNCLSMVTLSPEGVKVFALAGDMEFRGKRVKFEGVHLKEGEMYFFNGQPKLQGPFLIDLAELIRSSAITTDFPNNPWIVALLEKPVHRQKWMKNLGLVEPSEVMLEGASARSQRANPDASPAREIEKRPKD